MCSFVQKESEVAIINFAGAKFFRQKIYRIIFSFVIELMLQFEGQKSKELVFFMNALEHLMKFLLPKYGLYTV